MRRLIATIAFVSFAAAACVPPATTPATSGSKPAAGATAKPAEEKVVALSFPEGEPFRKEQPKPGPIKSFEQPPVTRFTLKNGVEVFLIEDHDLPTVSMQLAIPGGAIDDPKGKEGLASLCVGLMSEGTEKLDKIAFNEALADLASSVSSYASTEEQGLGLSSLSKNVDATLDLFTETLLSPGMRQDELDRMAKRRIESIRQAKGSPDSIAGRIAGSIVWGEGHAYGRILTEESTKAITLADCKAHIASYFKPKGAKLFVVGDMTRAQIEEKVGKRLASWTGAPKKTSVAVAAKPRAGKVFFVDVPDAPQSVVRLMHPGPKRTDPDYVHTMLMSSILGGGFSSRINMNIREAKGYAYGAGGGFSYTRAGSSFGVGGSIRADATAEAVREILLEMKKIRAEDVKDTELAREKDGTILSLPASWATGGQVLGTYKNLVYYGLPLDYYKTYVPKVQAATIADVRKAATKHVQPEKAQLLVVGDAKTVLPKLQEVLAAEMGGKVEVVTLDADGKVVKR